MPRALPAVPVPPAARAWRVAAAALLAAVASLGVGAELAWPASHDGTALPPGWEVARSAESQGRLRFEQGCLVLGAEPARHHLLSRAIDLDGTDQAPLRIEASIASAADKLLRGMPTCIALYWNPRNVLLIGLGGWDPAEASPDANWGASRRRAWCYWDDGSKRDRVAGDAALYPGTAPAHFRIVVTGRDVSALASADGLDYQTLASFPRGPGSFQGPPARVLIGRGGFGPAPDQEQPLLANDVGDAKLTTPIEHSIAGLSIANDPPPGPVRLTGYQKGEGWAETMAVVQADGRPRDWHLLGPCPENDTSFGPGAAPALDKPASINGKQLEWSAYKLPDDEIVLDFKDQKKVTGSQQVAYATTTFEVAQAGFERLHFDGGGRALSVYVDGVLVADVRRDRPRLVADRLSAKVWLKRGTSRVLIRMLTGWDQQQSTFTFRRQREDLGERIAVLRRLANDFPEDREQVVAAHQEIARLWETLGHSRRASEALDELLGVAGDNREASEGALFERARLNRQLRNQDGVMADIQELATRRMQEQQGLDVIGVQLKTARLWEQMGFPAKGVEAVDQAIAAKGIDLEQLEEAYYARARLHLLLDDPKAVIADLRALAGRLPAHHPHRLDIQLQALGLGLAAGDEGALKDLLAELGDDRAAQGQRLARVHNLLAGVHATRKDRKALLADLARLAETRAGEATWQDLRVEYAEALVGEGDAVKSLDLAAVPPADLAAAVDQYRKSLAQLPARNHPELAPRIVQVQQAAEAKQWAKALALARSASVRGCLLESATGARLLAAASSVSLPPATESDLVVLATPSQMEMDWAAIGPFDNGDYKAYSQVIVDPQRIDTGAQVQGKSWQVPKAEAYQERGYLDLKRLFANDNSVAFVYKQVQVPADGDGSLSIGCDDGLVLWVNGRKIHEDRESRGVTPGAMVFPVRFTKGANHILAMVQQGSGEWGFHCQVRANRSQGHDLAGLLNLVESLPQAHARVAPTLVTAIEQAQRAKRPAEALALARVLIRCFPDRFDLQLQQAERVLAEADGTSDAATIRELVEWMEAALERHALPDREAVIAGVRERAAERLAVLGDLELAHELRQRLQRADLRGLQQARTLVALADLQRIGGYPQAAAASYRKALDGGIVDPDLQRRAQERWTQVRLAKGDVMAFELPLDVATMMQTAERAATAGDLDRALRTWQRAIEQSRDELYRVAPDKLVGIGEYAVDRIRATGQPGIAAYRALFDQRASEAFAAARASNDLARIERVALEHPFSSVADDARALAAAVHLDLGHAAHAAQLLAGLLADHPDTDLDRVALRAKQALAWELAGDLPASRAALDRLLAEAAGKQLRVSGQDGPVEAYVAARRAALDAAPAPPIGSWPSAGGGPLRAGHARSAPEPGGCVAEIAFPVHPADQASALRFAPLPFQPRLAHAASDGATLWFHTLDETFAIDQSSGALRWRSGESFAELRQGRRQEGFTGIPETMTSVEGRLLYGRALRASGDLASAYAIEARDAASGRLQWSTENEVGLAGASATSSPAVAAGLVVAVFQLAEQRRNHLVAFDAASGRMRWRTALAGGVGGLTLTDQQEIRLGDHGAAPTIAGGDAYVATGLGSVIAVDLASGAIRWVATYPRSLLDRDEGRRQVRILATRAASRIVAGADALYVAPRDSLALLCIQRSNGDLRWRREFNDYRAVVGLAPAAAGGGQPGGGQPDGRSGETLVVQGSGLEGIDAVSGDRRWRWKPMGEDHTLHGQAALGGAWAYCSTGDGLYRVRLADGRTHSFDSWRTLGVESGAPGNLLLSGDRICGFTADRLVLLGAGADRAARKALAIPAPPASQALVAVDLPAAPFAPPLGLRWHARSSGEALVIPDEGQPGLAYLCLGQRLLRLDAASGAVAWQAAIVPEPLRIVSGKELVLLAYPRFICALDAKDGRLLWNRPMLFDDHGFSSDHDQQDLEGLYEELQVTPQAVLVRRRDGKRVELIDPRSGKDLRSVVFASNPRWSNLRDGQLIAVVQSEHKLAIEARDPLTDVQAWRQELSANGRDLRQFDVIDGDGPLLWLVSDKWILGFDLATKKERFSREVKLGEPFRARRDGERLLVWGKRGGDDWRSQLFDAASGKTLFDQPGYKGDWQFGPSPWVFVGDRALALTDQRQNERFTLLCRSLEQDKELWAIDVGHRHHKRMVGQVLVGKHLVQVHTSHDNRRAGYSVMGIEDGRTVGTGELPGLLRDGRAFSALAIGELFVYAGQQGVHALGGLPPAADGKPALAAAAERLAAAGGSDRQREAAAEFLLTHVPDTASAWFTGQRLRIDGRLDDWTAGDLVALDRPLDQRAEAGGWSGPADLSATVRCAWDRTHVYLGIEVTDDDIRTPAAGAGAADGDAVLIGIDPDGGGSSRGNESEPLILQLALIDGIPRLTQKGGRALSGPGMEGEDAVACRILRSARGMTYEIGVPWAALRQSTEERPGRRGDMGLAVAVFDRDGEAVEGAVELGCGLVRGIEPRLFHRLNFTNLTPERVASRKKFMQLMPDHETTWQFVRNDAERHDEQRGQRQRVQVFEEFLKAVPTSRYAGAALGELAMLYRQGGLERADEQAARFARQAGVGARAIGDGIGPGEASGNQGRAIRQWVWLDPQKPPQGIMMQFHASSEDWEHRAYWGQNLINWGENWSYRRRPMGPLPPTGKWVQLTVPLAAVRLDAHMIDGISFAVAGGTAVWDLTEYVEDGKVRTLLDDELPKDLRMHGGNWMDKPVHSGKRAHGAGFQGGTHDYKVEGAVLVDNRPPKSDEAPAARTARLTQSLAAAQLIPDDTEAVFLLQEAEGLHEGDKRTEGILGMYEAFLKAHPTSQQAARILGRYRDHLDGKDRAALAAALERCEKLMNDIGLVREQRRAFHAGYAPNLPDWKVLGWFDPQLAKQSIQAVLPPEQAPFDAKATFAGVGNDPLAWKEAGKVDWRVIELHKLIPKIDRKYPVAYLHTGYESPRAQERTLFVGCRGQFAVWVNGQRIGGVHGNLREFRRDEFALPVRLRKGANDILIKVSDDDGNAALSCRVGDINGRPLAEGGE